MRIVSIEPTPSPHSMKINVSEELPAGENYNYKHTDYVQTLNLMNRNFSKFKGSKIYIVLLTSSH